MDGLYQKDGLFQWKEKRSILPGLISELEIFLNTTIEFKVLIETMEWNNSRSARCNQYKIMPQSHGEAS